MSQDAGRLPDYLEHIVQAIDRITRYTTGLGAQQFLASDMVQDAVIRNLEVVGEASRNIQRHHPSFAAAHPELPLVFAYEMRNALAHGYFKIDLQVVWNTLQEDLPRLRSQAHQALTGLRKP